MWLTYFQNKLRIAAHRYCLNLKFQTAFSVDFRLFEKMTDKYLHRMYSVSQFEYFQSFINSQYSFLSIYSHNKSTLSLFSDTRAPHRYILGKKHLEMLDISPVFISVQHMFTINRSCFLLRCNSNASILKVNSWDISEERVDRLSHWVSISPVSEGQRLQWITLQAEGNCNTTPLGW